MNPNVFLSCWQSTRCRGKISYSSTATTVGKSLHQTSRQYQKFLQGKLRLWRHRYSYNRRWLKWITSPNTFRNSGNFARARLTQAAWCRVLIRSNYWIQKNKRPSLAMYSKPLTWWCLRTTIRLRLLQKKDNSARLQLTTMLQAPTKYLYLPSLNCL